MDLTTFFTLPFLPNSLSFSWLLKMIYQIIYLLYACNFPMNYLSIFFILCLHPSPDTSHRMQTPLTKARMKSIARCNCFAPFPVYASCSHHLSGLVSSLLFSRVVYNTVNANCTLKLSCIWIQWSMSCASNYLLYVWNILHYCSVLFLICKPSTDRYTREGFISVTRMQYSNEKYICKMSEAFTSSLIYWNVLICIPVL